MLSAIVRADLRDTKDSNGRELLHQGQSILLLLTDPTRRVAHVREVVVGVHDTALSPRNPCVSSRRSTRKNLPPGLVGLGICRQDVSKKGGVVQLMTARGEAGVWPQLQSATKIVLPRRSARTLVLARKVVDEVAPRAGIGPSKSGLHTFTGVRSPAASAPCQCEHRIPLARQPGGLPGDGVT